MTATIRHTNAYHGDAAIKDKLMAAIDRDQKADAILQGTYQNMTDNEVGFVGCAVGCAVAAFHGIHPVDDWHGLLEQDTDIPVQINHVIDSMFESLPSEDAPQFVLDVFGAIEPGADLSLVVSNLMLDILDEEEFGLSHLPDLADDVKVAVVAVSNCYRRRLAGDEPSDSEWEVAGQLARAARDARAARAARDAWDAWDAWAARAARDAWDAWAAWAARDAYVQWSSSRLIHHLANAPVPATV